MGKSHSPFGDGRVCGKIKELRIFWRKRKALAVFPPNEGIFPFTLIHNCQKGSKEFEKYNGPISHFKAYCAHVCPLEKDEGAAIRLFQKSLTGPALKWFTSLDRSKLASFEQLSQMFINQYSYNLDAKPKRSDLEALNQKGDESFSAYVGRWRAVAAQMRNKLDEEEQINIVTQLAHSSIAGYPMS